MCTHNICFCGHFLCLGEVLLMSNHNICFHVFSSIDIFLISQKKTYVVGTS